MPDAVLDALGDTARPAGDGDTIAGVPARYVATPGTTRQAAAVVRAAAAHDLAVVVRGAGTKQDWGMPPRRLDLVLDTTRLAGVVEHAAGDLVTVVRAGTTLSDLAERLAAPAATEGVPAPVGQQLALDPVLPGATVGGTVAVGTSGPRRMLYGTVRDLLIGVTVVRPDGVVARSGGKVVKNVAGYDLGKLMAGSYGTLGLVTECAFRLHPLPRAAGYVVAETTDPAAPLAAVRGSQVVPTALEVAAPPGGPIEVAVLLEGTATGVEHRAAATAKLVDGEVRSGPPAWFGSYPWGSGDVGIKLTAPLSAVPALLAAARDAADRHGVPLDVRGSAGTGVLYGGLPGDTDPEPVSRLVTDLRAVAEHAVVLTAPAPVRDALDVWGPVEGLSLMRRVKQEFDPHGRFAPGRFVGGI